MVVQIENVMMGKKRSVLNCYMFPSEAVQVCNKYEEKMNTLAGQYGISNPQANGYFLMELLLDELGISHSPLRTYNHKTAAKKLREDGTEILGTDTYIIQPVTQAQPVAPTPQTAPEPVAPTPVGEQAPNPVEQIVPPMPVQTNTVQVMAPPKSRLAIFEESCSVQDKHWIAKAKTLGYNEDQLIEALVKEGRTL